MKRSRASAQPRRSEAKPVTKRTKVNPRGASKKSLDGPQHDMHRGSTIAKTAESAHRSQYVSLTKQFGVSPPLSLSSPTKIDYRQTEALVQLLHRRSLYEPSEKTAARLAVLQTLETLFSKWIIDIGLTKV